MAERDGTGPPELAEDIRNRAISVLELAEKRMRDMIRRWPKFNIGVFQPRAEKTHYLVVLGQNLSEDQAEELRKRAVDSGLPRDTYIKRVMQLRARKQRVGRIDCLRLMPPHCGCVTPDAIELQQHCQSRNHCFLHPSAVPRARYTVPPAPHANPTLPSLLICRQYAGPPGCSSYPHHGSD